MNVLDLMSWMGFTGAARRSPASDQAHELVGEGALLLDVRTRGEFASAHLPGAMNIPVQELGGRAQELPPQDRSIVVYCRSGARSAAAAAELRRLGYRVHDLGPMSAW